MKKLTTMMMMVIIIQQQQRWTIQRIRIVDSTKNLRENRVMTEETVKKKLTINRSAQVTKIVEKKLKILSSVFLFRFEFRIR